MQPKTSSGKFSHYEMERRRNGRVYLKLPVLVRWWSAEGKAVQEPAVTVELSSGGGLLHIKRLPPEAATVEITHSTVEEPVDALVVRSEALQNDGLACMAISYTRQIETLWGVTFPNAGPATA